MFVIDTDMMMMKKGSMMMPRKSVVGDMMSKPGAKKQSLIGGGLTKEFQKKLPPVKAGPGIGKAHLAVQPKMITKQLVPGNSPAFGSAVQVPPPDESLLSLSGSSEECILEGAPGVMPSIILPDSRPLDLKQLPQDRYTHGPAQQHDLPEVGETLTDTIYHAPQHNKQVDNTYYDNKQVDNTYYDNKQVDNTYYDEVESPDDDDGEVSAVDPKATQLVKYQRSKTPVATQTTTSLKNHGASQKLCFGQCPTCGVILCKPETNYRRHNFTSGMHTGGMYTMPNMRRLPRCRSQPPVAALPVCRIPQLLPLSGVPMYTDVYFPPRRSHNTRRDRKVDKLAGDRKVDKYFGDGQRPCGCEPWGWRPVYFTNDKWSIAPPSVQPVPLWMCSDVWYLKSRRRNRKYRGGYYDW